MKVPNITGTVTDVKVSLSRLQNEGSQLECDKAVFGVKSIKATE